MQKLVFGLLVTFLATAVHSAGLIDEQEWGGALRIRYESVDDSLNEAARALTTRGTVFYKATSEQGFEFFAELEGVQGIGNYNDGGQNENTTHATIADPDGLELNRFYVAFSPIEGESNTVLKVGRFNCNHADEIVDRYLSNIGWRQNHRTYDGLNLDSTFGKSRLRTSVLFNVNRVFGEDNPIPTRANFDLRGFGLQYDLPVTETIGLEGYLYHFTFADIPRFSTQTIGVKLLGESPFTEQLNWTYKVDLAQQQGIDQNPNQDDKLGYQALSLGISYPSFANAKVSVNTEIFESNGTEAFITPLGSGHAYFGWADKFLNQPTIGINDVFFKFDMAFGDYALKLRWHTLTSDHSSIDYGTEFDWSVSGKLSEVMGWTVKGAVYTGDKDEANIAHFSRDTTKLWGWLSISF